MPLDIERNTHPRRHQSCMMTVFLSAPLNFISLQPNIIGLCDATLNDHFMLVCVSPSLGAHFRILYQLLVLPEMRREPPLIHWYMYPAWRLRSKVYIVADTTGSRLFAFVECMSLWWVTHSQYGYLAHLSNRPQGLPIRSTNQWELTHFKQDNILLQFPHRLCPHPAIFISDFGMALYEHKTTSHPGVSGTISYLPPEVIRALDSES